MHLRDTDAGAAGDAANAGGGTPLSGSSPAMISNRQAAGAATTPKGGEGKKGSEDKEGKEGGEAEEAREGEKDEEGKAAGVEGKGAAQVAALLVSNADRRPDDAGATDDASRNKNDDDWDRVCGEEDEADPTLLAAIEALDEAALKPALEAAVRAGRCLDGINLKGRKLSTSDSPIDLRRSRR